MPRAKQNQILQFLTPFVDKTDGFSQESGVTSNFTQRLWGVKHGVSTATVAKTPSKTLSVVRSGIFRVTLKSTEVSDFDEIIWQGTHASCADQLWAWTLYASDDSDLTSHLTILQSMMSDAHSAAAQANSRVLLNQSRLSDTYSMLSDLMSDFQSRVPKAVATNSQLSDLHSDLRSFLAVMSGVQSDIYSALSDFQSDFASRVPKRVATDSQLSDLHSDLRSYLVGMSGMLSDTYSLLSDHHSDMRSLVTVTGVELGASTMSDLRSAIAAVAATVTASDISDIASAVWANTIGARVDSRILLSQSRISDTYSMLSDLMSDFQSRVPKRVATDSQLSDVHSDLRSQIGGITASVSASDISDIASAVWANTIGARVDSRILLNQSRISDTYSMLSDFLSDFQSRVPKRVATDSQLSDVHSDLRSQIGGITASVSASDISDIASAVWANTIGARVDSRVLLNLSRISDVYSLLSDTASDLRSLMTTTGVELGASTLSDLRSAITAGGGTVSVSNISDIASAVYAIMSSDLSDILSAAQQTNSRALINQSRVSDIYSLLSDVASDVTVMSGVLSDAYSSIVALSDAVSNAYSAAAQGSSRALVIQSDTSNIYSLLSDVASDIGVSSGVQSDIYSLLTAVSAGVTDLSAIGSNVYSMLSDLMSDFQSRVPGRLTPAASALVELAVDPGANPTLAQAVMTVFMWLHNNGKTTSSKRFLRNFAGTTVLSAAIADDTVSFTQGKLG